MSLYAMGDLHLSFSNNKPMDIFGRRWKNHVAKIEKNWKKKITSKDTIVLTGDHSWGRNLDEAQEDLNFIINLPGRKILLRGNHDMFWDAKKHKSSTISFKESSNSYKIISITIRIMHLLEQKDIVMKEKIQ